MRALGSRAKVAVWQTSSVLFAALLLGACAPRPQMCTASTECGSKGACVAGRCQIEKAMLKPAVDSSRRIVVRPIDIGYSASDGSKASTALPSVFALGGGGGKLFLRFSVPLPPAANVIEAYVVLRRSSAVDDDPSPIALHADRIVEPWAGGTIDWALQPRVSDARLPRTTVEPSASALVRLDVRDLVRKWARRDPADHGIAIVAEGDAKAKATFALSGFGIEADSAAAGPGSGSSSRAAAVGDPEPYLELYVR